MPSATLNAHHSFQIKKRPSQLREVMRIYTETIWCERSLLAKIDINMTTKYLLPGFLYFFYLFYFILFLFFF